VTTASPGKLTSLQDAVSEHVRAGDDLHIVVGHTRWTAAAREVVRQWWGRDPRFTLMMLSLSTLGTLFFRGGLVERVVTDLIGLKALRNNIVVDPIRRAESPEPIDEHVVDEELHEGLLLGDRAGSEDPEAEHLHEDLRAELFGTTDVQESISEGIPWNPPDGPTPEGASGTDTAPDTVSDDR